MQTTDARGRAWCGGECEEVGHKCRGNLAKEILALYPECHREGRKLDPARDIAAQEALDRSPEDRLAAEREAEELFLVNAATERCKQNFQQD